MGRSSTCAASVTIEGRVENIQWKDPHVWINLTTDGGTAYRVEWTSSQGLSNRGITAESLKAGDRLVVTGSPMKDPASIKDPAGEGADARPGLGLDSRLGPYADSPRKRQLELENRGPSGMPPVAT